MAIMDHADTESAAYDQAPDQPQITRYSTLRGRSAGIPGNQRRYPLGSASDYLPRMVDTAGGLIGPTSCSCSLINKDIKTSAIDSTSSRRGSLFEKAR